MLTGDGTLDANLGNKYRARLESVYNKERRGQLLSSTLNYPLRLSLPSKPAQKLQMFRQNDVLPDMGAVEAEHPLPRCTCHG